MWWGRKVKVGVLQDFLLASLVSAWCVYMQVTEPALYMHWLTSLWNTLWPHTLVYSYWWVGLDCLLRPSMERHQIRPDDITRLEWSQVEIRPRYFFSSIGLLVAGCSWLFWLFFTSVVAQKYVSCTLSFLCVFRAFYGVPCWCSS